MGLLVSLGMGSTLTDERMHVGHVQLNYGHVQLNYNAQDNPSIIAKSCIHFEI